MCVCVCVPVCMCGVYRFRISFRRWNGQRPSHTVPYWASRHGHTRKKETMFTWVQYTIVIHGVLCCEILRITNYGHLCSKKPPPRITLVDYYRTLPTVLVLQGTHRVNVRRTFFGEGGSASLAKVESMSASSHNAQCCTVL